MGLSLSGLGSGMDINSMVQQLVEAERAPKQASITKKMNDIETHISAYGRVASALDDLNKIMSDFKNDHTFASKTATSSQSDVITAKASHDATNGVYDIEVKNLAQSHKIISGNIDSTQSLGPGEMTLSVGGQSMTINLEQENSQLIDVVRAINNDPSNPGIKASVINDDNGARLVLNSDKTGEANQIEISVNADAASPLNQFAFDPTNGNVQMTEMQAAKDANIVIDGLANVSSSTNIFTDAIQGVELDIKGLTNADKGPVTVLIEEDKAAVKDSLVKFVDSYNAFYQVTQSVAKFNPETKSGGPLMGDSVVRSSVNQIRNLFSSVIGGTPDGMGSLSELGITTTMEGRLEINHDILDKQLDNNFANLGSFFDGENGFASKLENIVDNFTGSSGAIKNRESSLAEQKNRLTDEQTNLNRRISEFEARTLKQFAAMDSAMGLMQSQLAAMQSMLP